MAAAGLGRDQTLDLRICPRYLLECSQQGLEMICTDIDNDIGINPKIVVNKDVSNAGDFCPGNVRTKFPHFVRHLLYRLTYDLKAAKHRIKSHRIGGKILNVDI